MLKKTFRGIQSVALCDHNVVLLYLTVFIIVVDRLCQVMHRNISKKKERKK